jgi:hypothetical protein
MDDPRIGHALVLCGRATGRPTLHAVEGTGRDELRFYHFALDMPGEGADLLTLWFHRPLRPAEEGWPAWLDLMEEGALVEVVMRTDDIGDLLGTGDGCLQDPGCTLIPQRVRVWLPEAGWR